MVLSHKIALERVFSDEKAQFLSFLAPLAPNRKQIMWRKGILLEKWLIEIRGQTTEDRRALLFLSLSLLVMMEKMRSLGEKSKRKLP
jgi:hypothetical protein